MTNLALVIMFAGILLVVHGIYQQMYKELKEQRQIQYRFIPRSLYDEQMTTSVSALYKNMFTDDEHQRGGVLK